MGASVPPGCGAWCTAYSYMAAEVAYDFFRTRVDASLTTEYPQPIDIRQDFGQPGKIDNFVRQVNSALNQVSIYARASNSPRATSLPPMRSPMLRVEPLRVVSRRFASDMVQCSERAPPTDRARTERARCAKERQRVGHESGTSLNMPGPLVSGVNAQSWTPAADTLDRWMCSTLFCAVLSFTTSPGRIFCLTSSSTGNVLSARVSPTPRAHPSRVRDRRVRVSGTCCRQSGIRARGRTVLL